MMRSNILLTIAYLISHLSVNGQSDFDGQYDHVRLTKSSLSATLQRSESGPELVPEWSSDLRSWFKSGETENGLTVTLSQTPLTTENGIEKIELQATVSNPLSGSLYLRVRAVDVEPAPEGFVTVPSGRFSMGSPFGEPTRLANETLHQVTLTKPIYMAATELTWAEWDRVRNLALDNGYFNLSQAGQNGRNGDSSGTHPVIRITWYEAVKWCNAKSEQEGKTPVYYTSKTFVPDNIFRRSTSTSRVYADWTANGYRLPTEAEWEFACRAGTTTAFFTGNIQHLEANPVDPNLDKAGWFAGNSGANTHTVGGKLPNKWGLYDMHGNVQEFCWDLYHPDYGGDATDPTGSDPDSGRTNRVTRGGSYEGFAQHCRSAHRDFFTGPAAASNYVGFRLVLNSVKMTNGE